MPVLHGPYQHFTSMDVVLTTDLSYTAVSLLLRGFDPVSIATPKRSGAIITYMRGLRFHDAARL